MSTTVEQIKERLGIADVVGSYIKLEKAGANMKARCPFHNEKTPSFFVSPGRGSYYCFGCGAKGDIFSFIQSFEGMDFMGALQILATRAGVELRRENPKVQKERERLFALLDYSAAFYESKLNSEKKAQEYLKKRGLKEETIKEWRIGYAPDEWRTCFDHCKKGGFTESEMEKAGLIKQEKGSTYDRFRSRVMFPIFDSAGRICAFSGRILGKESEHSPKYLNSPETQVFSKSRILHGFDRAKAEIRRKDYSMLVEGQMDLIMAHQGGFKNTVASSGTAFTEDQVIMLKRLSNRLLMVYDADSAGVNAALRSAKLALSMGMEVKVAALPKGADPAEMLVNDPKKFSDCLRKSSHIIEFYLENICSQKLDDRLLMKAVRDKLLNYVSVLDSSIERDHFIAKISNRTGIREEAIREDLKKAPSETTEPERKAEIKLSPRRSQSERLISGLLLWQESEKQPAVDVKKIRQEVGRILGSEGEKLLEKAFEMKDELIFQAESYYQGKDLDAAFEELIITLEEDSVVEKLSEAMKLLSEAERVKESDKSKLLSRCQELSGKLNELRAKRHVFNK